MSHDPLHIAFENEGLDVFYFGPVGQSDHIDCLSCYYIAKVRADEREKAARRVESCVNKFKARDFNDAVDACAAAVRGES